jgi:hypothetical protein
MHEDVRCAAPVRAVADQLIAILMECKDEI